MRLVMQSLHVRRPKVARIDPVHRDLVNGGFQAMLRRSRDPGDWI